MSVDYQHPLVLEMKRFYRGGRDAYEEFLSVSGSVPLPQKLIEESHHKALDSLTTAQSQIPMLMEQMKSATDIPQENREYYENFMGNHLADIQTWLRDI